jgi:hypothetical protein
MEKKTWVDALQMWNADNKKVQTKQAFAVPRKGTTEYIQVKKLMEGKDYIKKTYTKKTMDMRGERRASKEIVNDMIGRPVLKNYICRVD